MKWRKRSVEFWVWINTWTIVASVSRCRIELLPYRKQAIDVAVSLLADRSFKKERREHLPVMEPEDWVKGSYWYISHMSNAEFRVFSSCPALKQ